MPADSGRRALADLDAALASRPDKDGQAFAAAVEHLAAFRDAALAHRDENGFDLSVSDLTTLNGVITVALAGQFPLGDVPWGEIEKARTWLAGLLD